MRTSLLACGLVLALWTSAAGARDDEAIDALLERMEAAVLAGDGASYLACVEQSPPEWAREQENWAKDLTAHRPEAFDLALESALTPVERGVRGTLAMAWRLEGGGDRRASFEADFVEGPEGWRYAGEAWATLASEDGQTVVLFLGEDLREPAGRIVEIMPEVRAHVDEGFETSLDHPQVVKLYPSMEHLQSSIYLSYTEPLGGWNEPGESIKLLGDPGARARMLRRLLAHEYGHVATFTYGPGAAKMAWWVLEGTAELASERFGGRYAATGVDDLVRAWASAGSLVEWSRMSDFRSTPAQIHTNVYVQGQHMLGYISEHWGRAGRNAWLRAQANGMSLDEATRAHLGVAFEELDAQWREALVAPKPEEGAEESGIEPGAEPAPGEGEPTESVPGGG